MHATTAPPRYAAMLKVRVPEGMPGAVAQVARRRHQSASEYIRQLVLDDLAEQGLRLGPDGQLEHMAVEGSA
jgi:Arc/MetJ-type ribon-helix-helix transcriptional regulator